MKSDNILRIKEFRLRFAFSTDNISTEMQTTLPLQFPRLWNPPEFSKASLTLAPVSNVAFQALEYGRQSVVRYYTDGESDEPYEPENPWVSATIVRDRSLRLFRRERIQAQEDGIRWSVGTLPFVGIEILAYGYNVKMLKAKDGVVPGCGASRPKNQFYNQIPKFYLGRDQKPKRTTANLLLLWDFKDSVPNIWLACPVAGGYYPHQVRLAWQEEIPYPGQSVIAPAAKTTGDDLDSLIAFLDLPASGRVQ